LRRYLATWFFGFISSSNSLGTVSFINQGYGFLDLPQTDVKEQLKERIGKLSSN
jgi:hypothetical protein